MLTAQGVSSAGALLAASRHSCPVIDCAFELRFQLNVKFCQILTVQGVSSRAGAPPAANRRSCPASSRAAGACSGSAAGPAARSAVPTSRSAATWIPGSAAHSSRYRLADGGRRPI